MVNNKKICFISCVNDENVYARACEHIKRLTVPDKMQIECIAVRGAFSIFSAYNQAMQESDAKYKIYLHQDVMITDRDFLIRLIACFRQDKSIGIAGVVGSIDLPMNGIWWFGQMAGRILDDSSNPGHLAETVYTQSEKPLDAAVLDGLLLATQYDISWRSDIFSGWHGYDISQCLEYRRRNYRCVILSQTVSACTHICGSPATNGYFELMHVILKEYRNEFLSFNPKIAKINRVFSKIYNSLLHKESEEKFFSLAELEIVFKENDYRNFSDNEIHNILIVCDYDSLGLVSLSGVIKCIRNKYADSRIMLLVDQSTKAVAVKCQDMDYLDFIVFEQQSKLEHKFSYYTSFSVHNLLYHHFDLAFCFADKVETLLLTYFSGARERIGFSVNEDVYSYTQISDAGRLLTCKYSGSEDSLVSKSYALLEQYWNENPGDKTIKEWYTQEDLNAVLQLIDKLNCRDNSVIMIMWVTKDNCMQCGQVIDDLLLDNDECKFVLLGNTEEGNYRNNLVKSSKNSVIAVNYELNCSEMVLLLRLCKYFIGSKCRLSTIAKEMNIPVVDI